MIEAPQEAAAPCAPSGPIAGTSLVSGVATYESVPNLTTGPLNYDGATDKPIRGATVTVINAAQQVLDSCVSGDDGSYVLKVPDGSGPVQIRVRAELFKDSGPGGTWNFTVRDNVRGNALYVLDSAAFTPAGDETRNIAAGSGFDGTRYSGPRAAGPFAILDTAFAARAKVLEASPNQAFPPLKLFWSVNNNTSLGNFSAGDIGTSFYIEDGTEGHTLFLLGQENVDTDEYDSHVVAHEWGHYFQSAFSRDDSLGGNHGSGDRLDMRVAFSEGWGNGWSGIVFADEIGGEFYADSQGNRQANGFSLDVSAPASDPGWFSEDTVQFLMFSFAQNNNVGFPAMFNVLTNTLPQSQARTSIHAFATLLKNEVGAAGDTFINDRLTQQGISTANDVFGGAETNNGGVSQSLPIYHAAGEAQYCTSDLAGEFNKLGNRVFIRFTRQGQATLRANANPPNAGSDPDFVLVDALGSRSVHEEVGNETATVQLPAGTHTVELFDFNHLNDGATSGQRCFTFTVQ